MLDFQNVLQEMPGEPSKSQTRLRTFLKNIEPKLNEDWPT